MRPIRCEYEVRKDFYLRRLHTIGQIIEPEWARHIAESLPRLERKGLIAKVTRTSQDAPSKPATGANGTSTHLPIGTGIAPPVASSDARERSITAVEPVKRKRGRPRKQE